MPRLEFSKLPVNTLVGADWSTFRRLTRGQQIDKGKRGKYWLTMSICRILSLMAPLSERRYRKLLADRRPLHDPLFILGHWRSGTTYVHNIFAQDPHFAYTTTYQTVFPHYTLALQGLFKPTMSALMPEHRPTDNMPLGVDMPQEEEFAIQNMCPVNYYNFWFFPRRMQEYCDRYLTFAKATPEEIEEFKRTFDKLVRISIWNTLGDRKDAQYLSKNPPHTGRLRVLTEMYPEAKFIYLMRNPYTVFRSSMSFFTNTIAPLELHSIPNEELEHNILRNYVELYHAYKEQKACVPKGNLVEVRFEDIEKDALSIVRRIYTDLRIPGWEKAHEAIEAYIASQGEYKKNRYDYDEHTVSLVNEYLGPILDEWGYERL